MESTELTPPETGACVCPEPGNTLARLYLPPGFSYTVSGYEISLPCGLCLLVTRTGETQLKPEQVKQLFQSYLADVMKALDPSRFIYVQGTVITAAGQKEGMPRANVLPHYK
ncbi:MAG: hypothetical protein K6T80_02105 [Firmicutes bacterium]|nr:hypothetical protein [Bacillota bacterium]